MELRHQLRRRAAQTVPASGILDVSAFDTTRLALSSTGPDYLVNSLGSEPNIFRIVRWVNGAYLVNSAALALRGGASRGVVTNDISIFHSDANGNFVELVYAPVTAASEPTYTGRLIGTIVYAGDATVTIPDGAGQGKGRITGGAGGSGGAQAYSGGGYNAASGGSGAPGYSEFLLTGLIPGNTLTFTVGAGGTAGAGGGATVPTAGGNGTASTLASGTQTISTITANGSNGTGAALSSGSPKPLQLWNAWRHVIRRVSQHDRPARKRWQRVGVDVLRICRSGRIDYAGARNRRRRLARALGWKFYRWQSRRWRPSHHRLVHVEKKRRPNK